MEAAGNARALAARLTEFVRVLTEARRNLSS